MPLALLILGMISIQIGASLAKQLFPILGVAGTSLTRVGFAAIILALVVRPWRHKLTQQQLKNIALYGMCLGFMNLTFYLSLQYIPLGIAVALEFLGPLAVAIISSRSRVDFLWALLAGLGVWFVFPTPAQGSAELAPIGLALAFVAACFWALYIVFGARAGRSVPGIHATSFGMGFAFLAILPFGVAWDGSKLLNMQVIPMAIGVAFLSSALPYSLEMYALKRMPAKTFSVFLSLEPAFASIAGLFMLSERLTYTQWLAIGCIISASLGAAITHREHA